MAYMRDDVWIWDFWIADDGDTFHLFHLQADKALGDPDLRHWHPSIGHAISKDLITWTRVADAFAPGPAPSFDDGTTWTGSVLKQGNEWFMFYTGNTLADDNKKQRIGLATSPDLMTWTKLGMVLDLDPLFYEEYDPARWHDRSLRDPWVFADPAGGWRMVFTARTPHQAWDEAGCIGQARSADLLHWEALPPLFAPGISGEMEVPQYLTLGGRHYLLFCTGSSRLAATFKAANPEAIGITGTHYAVADQVDGPYRLGALPFFAGNEAGSLYASRLVRARDGQLVLLGFRNHDVEGRFRGGVSDPIPVIVREDGRLELAGSLALG